MHTLDHNNPASITCPACGLLCDDIALSDSASNSKTNACTKSITFFDKALNSQALSPSVAGKNVELSQAIQAAADILRKSNQPLFAGLGTEVQGMRAIMQLAEKTGATLDHMHSEGTVQNTLAMQNGGWQTTTFSEIKNRADVILAIGTDIVSSHPRFFEKLVWNTDSLFNKPSPEIIYLGASGDATKAGTSPDGKLPTVVTAEISMLPEVLNALNALLNDKNPLSKKAGSEMIAGVAISSLQTILEKLKAAKYAVVVWSAYSLKAIPHAELTIQSITQLIAKLNETNRVAGLPLNSGDGDSSVNNTSAWLTGYPTRNRFIKNSAVKNLLQYDAYHLSTKQQLNNCDALLWVSTFNAVQPPKSEVPTIVIGHPSMQFDVAPAVFIPVGVPGVHHIGTMFRMDSSITMPLKKAQDSQLSSLSEVIQKIEALLA